LVHFRYSSNHVTYLIDVGVFRNEVSDVFGDCQSRVEDLEPVQRNHRLQVENAVTRFATIANSRAPAKKIGLRIFLESLNSRLKLRSQILLTID
jgi:hypothetical protein